MRQIKISKQLTNRDATSLDKYLQEIAKINLITADMEVQLTQQIKKGNQIAFEKLIKANLRFVVSVAKQYQNQGLDLTDLINEGNLGLIKAAKHFDETRGFKFISYAVWWIRQAILKALAEHSRVIRLPLNKIDSINKINKMQTLMEQENNRPPVPEEIAEKLKMPLDEIRISQKNSKRHLSLDAPLINGENLNLYDVLNFSKFPNPDQDLLNESLKFDLQRVLQTLNTREAEVILLCFGLNETPILTLDEIAKNLHLTRERVRQIKDKSLRRLKSLSRSELLKMYL